MPACSAGLPLVLCQRFPLAPRVGSNFRSKRMGWCLCTWVSAGHWSTGVCLEQLFLSFFLKMYKPVIQMHHPNFDQVIKVQLSPQNFLKESYWCTRGKSVCSIKSHLLGCSGAHKMCISPDNSFSGVESQLASQQTHFSSVFSKCILSIVFHSNRLLVPGSALHIMVRAPVCCGCFSKHQSMLVNLCTAELLWELGWVSLDLDCEVNMYTHIWIEPCDHMGGFKSKWQLGAQLITIL